MSEENQRGKGERILDFDFEEAAEPVLKFSPAGNVDQYFDIGERLIIGSNKEKVDIYIDSKKFIKHFF